VNTLAWYNNTNVKFLKLERGRLEKGALVRK